jgi:hypothetical protein
VITSIRASWWVVLAVVLCLAPSAVGQAELDLTSAGNNVQDDVYVGPYYATIGTNQNQPIICDDFADESKLNTQWPASVTSFSSLLANNANVYGTVWGNYYQGTLSASIIVTMYEEAAYLTLQMLALGNSNATLQGYYSYAIWAVMDPADVVKWLTVTHPNSTIYNAVFGTGGLLAVAQSSYMNGNYSDLLIYSPLINGQVCTPNVGGGGGNCQAQEFFGMMMQVPEGGSALAYLLLAGVSCFGAMFFRHRRSAPGVRPAA